MRLRQINFIDRGLSVVLAAFVAAAGCLLFLNWQRTRAVQLSASDCEQIDLIVHLSGLLERISNYSGYSVKAAILDNRFRYSIAVEEKKAAADELLALRRQISPADVLSPVLEHISGNFEKLTSLIEGGANSGIAGDGLLAAMKRAPVYLKLLDEMVEETEQVLNRQLLLQKKLDEVAAASLFWQTVACALGFGSAFAGTAVFLVFYYAGIRRRLHFLAMNAAQLGELQPILRPDPQQDEFNELNKIIVATADDLMSSSAARTFLLCTVAHDIRSPLTSAGINLELLSRDCAPVMQPPLRQSRSCLDEVLPFVDDLLHIEQVQAASRETVIEELLLEDFCDTELAEMLVQAKALGINLEYEFGAQVLEVGAAQLKAALSLTIGYLLANLSAGSRMRLSCECKSVSDFKIFFRLQGPAGSSEGLSFIEDDFVDLENLRPSPRNIKLRPALYSVNRINADLLYQGYLDRGSVSLVIATKPARVESAGSPFSVPTLSAAHKARPWLATFLLSLVLPALIMTAAFVGVYQQVQEAGTIMARSRDSMKSVLFLCKTGMLTMKVASRAMVAAFSNREASRAAALAAVKANSSFVETNLPQAGLSSEIAQVVMELKQICELEADAIRGLSMSGSFSFIEKVRGLEERSRKLGMRLRECVIREQAGLIACVDALRETQAPLNFWFWLVGLDFLALVLMIIAFRLYFIFRYRQVRGRLASAAGALQMPAQDDLPLGNDELSVLEYAVSTAARQIADNTQYRRRFVTLVRKSIEGPVGKAESLLAGLNPGAVPLGFAEQERLNRALQGLRLVRLLIDELVNLEETAQLQKLNLQDFRVSEFLFETAALLQSLAEGRGVKLITNCDHSGDLTFRGDRKRLLQVLTNLIGNAIKFSPAGTEVVISSAFNSGVLRIAVRDHGPGLGQASIDRLFQPFYQAVTTQKAQGFGLGLSSAKYAVELHGGRLDVESTGKSGTTFVVELPCG